VANELEITDAIQRLIDKKLDVRSHIVTGWWKDTGKLEDLLEANRMILLDLPKKVEGTVHPDSTIEGHVVVGPGTEVVGSVLRGPLIIAGIVGSSAPTSGLSRRCRTASRSRRAR